MKKMLLKPLYKVNNKINYIANQTNRLQRQAISTQIVGDCVENAEHKAILYAMLQEDLRVIVDSRQVCMQNMQRYFDVLQPAKLDNLARFGGEADGGYVMLPPPPPPQAARSLRHSH